jgi:hypothetical protein
MFDSCAKKRINDLQIITLHECYNTKNVLKELPFIAPKVHLNFQFLK